MVKNLYRRMEALRKERIDITQLRRFVVGRLCIDPGHPKRSAPSWEIDDVQLTRCYCPGNADLVDKKLSCMMTQDLVLFLKAFKKEFEDITGLVRNLGPSLTLVGSIIEGTRALIANELDVTITWQWPEMFKVVDDAFNLRRATRNVPEFMEGYFDDIGQFKYDKFFRDLLEATELSVNKVFEKGTNPARLRRVTTNETYQKGNCADCTQASAASEKVGEPCKQCPRCNVTVSQTKLGLCLQLHWFTDDDLPVYCSIDLVPQFSIKPIQDLKLLNTVNKDMLLHCPKNWFKYVIGYAGGVKFVRSIIADDGEGSDYLLHQVSLKILNYTEENYYYILPAEKWKEDWTEPFRSELLKEVYGNIKVLKKILREDNFKSFLCKKLLSKMEYSRLESQAGSGLRPGDTGDLLPEKLLFHVLCQPEFKVKFHRKIDYERYSDKDHKMLPVKITTEH